MFWDSSALVPLVFPEAQSSELVELADRRAADALQLAAGLVACEDQPWNESFVCLDRRLRAAAAQEGFTVVPADGT